MMHIITADMCVRLHTQSHVKLKHARVKYARVQARLF